MSRDVEEIVSRELREVADNLRVPALPALPREPAHRRWRPLVAAAAAVVVVAGGVAVATRGGAPEPTPAPAPPAPGATASPSRGGSPSATASSLEIPRSAPSVPFVLDRALFVDGNPVPGEWWSVEAGEAAWLALRTDNTWWWGWDAEPHQIEGAHDTPPVTSPGGRYIAYTTVENGRGFVTGFDTRPAGERIGGQPVDLGDRQDGSLVTVRAVTDDGAVVVQGSRTALLWQPRASDGDGLVDLAETAPGTQVLAATPAGIVATRGADSRDGEPFLADLSEAGELTAKASVPAYDSLAVSPSGTWLTWLPPGTLGGEVTTVAQLQVQRVDGRGQAVLSAPDGWAFGVEQWAWENDDYLIAPVASADGAADGASRERMVRCSPAAGRCVLIRTH